jgi:hypothetical protein
VVFWLFCPFLGCCSVCVVVLPVSGFGEIGHAVLPVSGSGEFVMQHGLSAFAGLLGWLTACRLLLLGEIGHAVFPVSGGQVYSVLSILKVFVICFAVLLASGIRRLRSERPVFGGDWSCDLVLMGWVAPSGFTGFLRFLCLWVAGGCLGIDGLGFQGFIGASLRSIGRRLFSSGDHEFFDS